MEAPKFWKKAVFWIAFSLAAGVLSSWLTRDGLERFEQIAKPALTPPRIVFPIAWTILLFLIGYGFALIREKTMGTSASDTAAVIFGLQMTASVAFSSLTVWMNLSMSSE